MQRASTVGDDTISEKLPPSNYFDRDTLLFLPNRYRKRQKETRGLSLTLVWPDNTSPVYYVYMYCPNANNAWHLFIDLELLTDKSDKVTNREQNSKRRTNNTASCFNLVVTKTILISILVLVQQQCVPKGTTERWDDVSLGDDLAIPGPIHAHQAKGGSSKRRNDVRFP